MCPNSNSPLPPPEMLESSNLVTFNGLANSSSYDAFLLDEERGRLLVGAEDHIFSFDLVNINRDHKQVTDGQLVVLVEVGRCSLFLLFSSLL